MNNKNTLDGEYGEYNSNLSMRIMDEASFIGSVSVIYLRDILVFHVFSAGVDLFFCMVVYYDGSQSITISCFFLCEVNNL